MINELFLYGRKDSVFKNVIAQITDINTYHVSPNYGHDLNTDNLQLFIKDPVLGLKDLGVEKYPIAVCVTPRSAPVKLYDYRWEHFFFSIYFLERTGYEPGSNKARDVDKDSQLSQDTPPDSWSRMKLAAMDFLDILELTLKGMVTTEEGTLPFKSLLNVDFNKTNIRRLSLFNVDKLSGVELQFEAYLSIAQCQVIIGDIAYVVNTMLPERDPIWEDEKGDYVRKDELQAEVFEVTAGQDLSSGRIIYISAGKAYYYDPSNTALAGLVLGITKNAALTDTLVTVQLSGVFEQTGLGLTPDSRYFIGPNGVLTTSLSGLSVLQQAGVSIDSNRFKLSFYSPYITA